MLQFPNTRIVLSVERPVAAGFTIDQEGKALVSNYQSGVFGAKKSAGTGSEVFLGVSVNMLKPITEMPFNETLTPSGNTFTLSYLPLAGTIRIVNTVTGTVQAAGTPASNANQYSISGQTVTINVAQNGQAMAVTYRFAPTVAQVIALYGNVHPGGAAGDYLGQIGIIEKGDVFTTEYDTSVDWNSGGVVTLGANGLFSIGGSGNALPNVSIIAPPASGAGVLGLEIR